MKLLALILRRLGWFAPTRFAKTFVIPPVISADPVALVAGDTRT